MDKETQVVYGEQKALQSLIGHEGWSIARQKLVDRILELQTIGEVADVLEEGNAEKFMFRVSVKKGIAEELFNWLKEIEGTASQADETVQIHKSHIYIKQ